MPAPSFQRCCVVCLKMPFIPERWVRPLNVSSRTLPLGVQLPHSILGALPIWTMIINLFLVWMIPKNLETMPWDLKAHVSSCLMTHPIDGLQEHFGRT